MKINVLKLDEMRVDDFLLHADIAYMSIYCAKTCDKSNGRCPLLERPNAVTSSKPLFEEFDFLPVCSL